MSNRLSQEKSPYLQQPVTDFREPALYDTFVSAANPSISTIIQ